MGRLVNVVMLVCEIEFMLVGPIFAAKKSKDGDLGRR